MHNFARKPRSLRRKLHQYDVAVPIGPSKAGQAVPTFTTNQVHSEEEAFQFLRDNKSYVGDFFLLREENNTTSSSSTPMCSPNRTPSSNTTQPANSTTPQPPTNATQQTIAFPNRTRPPNSTTPQAPIQQPPLNRIRSLQLRLQ